jgi:hypothetical protein
MSKWPPPLHGKIPLWLKVAYTAFTAILIPFYWDQYGPANFLWFCDVALLVTLAALWLESRFLASMQAVGIVLPQLLWAADFVVRALTGTHIVDLTEYMFRPSIPLYVRGLSSFHGWIPFLLLWMLWKLGYDRRAWIAQTLLCWVVLWTAYLVIDNPLDASRAGNVNKIGGPSDENLQTWMNPRLWIVVLMVIYPICIYLPSHLLLSLIFRKNGLPHQPEA